MPQRVNKKLVKEILEMYSKGELSATKACEMLGVPRASFYHYLSSKKVPLPEKLNQSILQELKNLETKKK